MLLTRMFLYYVHMYLWVYISVCTETLLTFCLVRKACMCLCLYLPDCMCFLCLYLSECMCVCVCSCLSACVLCLYVSECMYFCVCTCLSAFVFVSVRVNGWDRDEIKYKEIHRQTFIVKIRKCPVMVLKYILVYIYICMCLCVCISNEYFYSWAMYSMEYFVYKCTKSKLQIIKFYARHNEIWECEFKWPYVNFLWP